MAMQRPAFLFNSSLRLFSVTLPTPLSSKNFYERGGRVGPGSASTLWSVICVVFWWEAWVSTSLYACDLQGGSERWMPDSKESLQEEGRVGKEGQNNMGSLLEFNKRRFHISVYFFFLPCLLLTNPIREDDAG